jgi:hypothetical protein
MSASSSEQLGIVLVSLATKALQRARRAVCGLCGHHEMLRFEGKRVLMHCASCGHDSPGWDTGGRAPRRRPAFAGARLEDPRRI